MSGNTERPTRSGRRVYPDADGHLVLDAGDYGQHPNGEWHAWPPNTDLCGSLRKHTVVEHDDGTITVSPSILVSNESETWHGYLEKGEWRTI